MKALSIFFTFVCLIGYANITSAQDASIFSVSPQGIITTKAEYILPPTQGLPLGNNNVYLYDHPIVKVGNTSYELFFDRFAGWEEQPGNFDQITVRKNNVDVYKYTVGDGIVKLNARENLYASQFESYSNNGYFIEIPLTATSKALIFLGQHYGSDFGRLIIFVMTESDVKMVFDRRYGLTSIVNNASAFSMKFDTIMTDGDYPPAIIHTIYRENGILKYRQSN